MGTGEGVRLLAAGLTGFLGIPLALQVFFTERVLQAKKSSEGVGAPLLASLLCFSVHTFIVASVAWWAWSRPESATPHELIFGISLQVGLALIFLPVAAFALGGGILAVWLLASAAVRWMRRTPP